MIRFNEFSQAICRKMAAEHLTQREASDEIGISASTMSRIVNGVGTPDADLYKLCCNWLGVPAARFIETDEDVIVYGAEQDKLEIIIDLILRDPEIPQKNKRPFVEIFTAAYRALQKKPQTRQHYANNTNNS